MAARSRRVWLVAAAIGCAAGWAGAAELAISGVVRDENGPVHGALVRVQTTGLTATTDEQGEFELAGVRAWPFNRITAFAPGYFIAGPVLAWAGDRHVSLTLHRHAEQDNPDYVWLSAEVCQGCHSDPERPDSLYPYDEWKTDAHGTSAMNRRFLSMYNGTDLSGEFRSPLTRYIVHRDYGRIPVRPDPGVAYYGPGYKLDFPDSAGNCAACHLPAASANAPYQTDPNLVSEVGREGVTCGVCHKVWDVKLDPSTGLPFPNMPGVMSVEFRRPSGDHQLFIGPYDDVAPGEDTYSPLQNQSQICAPLSLRCVLGGAGLQLFRGSD